MKSNTADGNNDHNEKGELHSPLSPTRDSIHSPHHVPINSAHVEQRSQASMAVKSGVTTVGKKTAYQTLANANKKTRSQFDQDSASQDDAWSHDSQRSPHKLQAKGAALLRDDDLRRRKSKSPLMGECLNDDIIDVQENETPPILQPQLEKVRTVTASDSKDNAGKQRKTISRPGKTGQRELSIKTGRAKLRSDRIRGEGEDDKNTVYEYSDLHSPKAARNTQNTPIGNVQIMSSTTQSRIPGGEKTVVRTMIEPPIDELINSISEDHQTIPSAIEPTEQPESNDELEQEEFFLAAQKPLPLKRIARQQVYKRSQRLSKPSLPGAQPQNRSPQGRNGRNERLVSLGGGSQRNSVFENKTPLMIDARSRQHDLFRSPFRQQKAIGRNSNRTLDKTSQRHFRQLQGGGGRVRLEQSKYDLSPTTTNLLSQKSGNPSGSNISIFATSFNKLPSVVNKKNQIDLVKALFKPEDQSVQTMKATGSSSYFPPESFLNKEQTIDVSMMSLLQKVAQINAKKKFRKVKLNEQSEVNLPMEPSILREMEAMRRATEENNHIKIMGDNNPLFVMQPNAINANSRGNMVGRQLNQKSRQEQYQVMITSSKKLESMASSIETGQEQQVQKIALKGDKESSIAINKNVLDMLELADKLNSVASNDGSKKQISSKHDSPINNLGQSRRLSDHQVINRISGYHEQSKKLNPHALLQQSPPKMPAKQQRMIHVPSFAETQTQSLNQSPSNTHYAQQQQVQQAMQAERSFTGPHSVHNSTHRSPLPSLRQRDIQGHKRMKTLNMTQQKSPRNNLSQKRNSNKMAKDVSFGALEKSLRYFDSYTDKQKQQLMQLAQKFTTQPKKPQKGLAFKNGKREAAQLVSFGKQDTQSGAEHQFNQTMGSVAFTDEIKSQQNENPLMFQVTSPVTLKQDKLDYDNGKQTTITLYPVDLGPNQPNEPLSPDKSQASPPSPSRLRHRFSIKDDDERESVKIKDPNFLNFQTQCKMQLTVQTPAQRGLLQSQDSQKGPENFEKASMMTKFNRNLHGYDTQQQWQQLKQYQHQPAPPSFSIKPVEPEKPSFAHQNSNQNLYSKEVLLKFPHNRTTRKVLMKVQGGQSRKKQAPSIPYKFRMLANDSEEELKDLPENLPDELPQSPGIDDSEAVKSGEDQGLTTARHSVNPFSSAASPQTKMAIQSDIDLTSKEYELEKTQQIESDLLSESKKMLQQLQQEQQQAYDSQDQQFNMQQQHIQMMAPRVTLTSRLSKGNDSKETKEDKVIKQAQQNQPMTKKEFLELYKQSVASSIKEQKKVNKEKLEQKRMLIRRRSSAMEHQNIIETEGDCAVKTGHWPTLALDGSGTDPHSPVNETQSYTDKMRRSSEYVKSANHDHRLQQIPGGMLQINPSLAMTILGGVPTDPTSQQSAAFATFEHSQYKFRPKERNVMDSIETQEGMIAGTLKLPKETAAALVNAGMTNSELEKLIAPADAKPAEEVTSLSSRGSDMAIASGGVQSNPELPSGQDLIIQPESSTALNIPSTVDERTPQAQSGMERKPFEELEKMDHDEEGLRQQLEQAKIEFAKNMPSNKRIDKNALLTERPVGRKSSVILSAVSSKNKIAGVAAKKLRHRDSITGQGSQFFKESYMPRLDKQNKDKGYIIEKNNEDIMNLLTPEVTNTSKPQ